MLLQAKAVCPGLLHRLRGSSRHFPKHIGSFRAGMQSWASAPQQINKCFSKTIVACESASIRLKGRDR